MKLPHKGDISEVNLVVGTGPRDVGRQCRICVLNGVETRKHGGEEVSNTTSEPQLH